MHLHGLFHAERVRLHAAPFHRVGIDEFHGAFAAARVAGHGVLASALAVPGFGGFVIRHGGAFDAAHAVVPHTAIDFAMRVPRCDSHPVEGTHLAHVALD